MTISKYLTTISFGMLLTTVTLAQGKLAVEADEAFNKGFYFNAIELYKKAYTVEKTASAKADLIFKVGESYRALGDAQQSEVWYEKANKAQYADPITYYWIGESLKQQGKYAEAIAAFNKYKEKKPNDMRADASILACQNAQKWKDSPTRYSVDPEVLLNTPDYDFTPAFADKKNEIVVFTSTRSGASGTDIDQIIGTSFSDLFTSSRDRLGKWSEPTKLPSELNTFGNEGAPIFNEKRNLMYFTRCPMEKKKVYGCDIWVSKKVGNNYSAPEMLVLKPEKDKNDSMTVGHPALTADDGMMIFASNVPFGGHKGGKDLYYIKLDKDGKPVGTPVNLGADINTPKDELFPFVREDGSLYFATSGFPGMGGMDQFRAEPAGEGKWTAPENLKAPLNSPYDDFGIIYDGKEDRGYFTSNRPGGKGMDDIWRFFMPNMEFALQGTVYDKITSLPISGANISVVGTNGSNFSATTDENGGFNFAENGKDRYIKENTSYSILAEKEGYLVVKDQVTTVGLNESTTFAKEYFLQPTIIEGSVVDIKLPEVQYDLGKHFLREESKDSLETLYQTMIDNPTIVIELSAHTDSRDNDARNMTLSQNRAQSCVNYLVTKGIDPARMVPKGYGESKLRITDKQIAAMKTKEEQEAAHQQNRRTEFRVLRWDFVPKEGGTPPAPEPEN
ncbi:MAG: OmpA family protein [Flavobacteriales bacterium]|nr:OmpA family protein [Flavobacteriales bacterium]